MPRESVPRRPPVPLKTGSIAALLCLVAGSAPAAEPAVSGAVQARKYGTRHELRLAVGTMPLDPFQKGFTAGLAYTYHLSPHLAWEVLEVTGALLDPTSLYEELVGTFARRPDEFSAPRLLLSTGLELSPMYGKQVLFNRDTVHGAVVLGAYAGLFFGDRPTFDEMLEDLRPALGGGLGFRIYASSWLSARFDGRLFAALRRALREGEPEGVETVGLFTLSASFGFGDVP